MLWSRAVSRWRAGVSGRRTRSPGWRRGRVRLHEPLEHRLLLAASAIGDGYFTDEDALLTVSAPGVLHNDGEVSSDLLAYWSFDDGTAADHSGNGHDGTLHGGIGLPTYQADTADDLGGLSLLFDDTNDERVNQHYVSLDLSFGGLSAIPELTVSAWFKTSATDTVFSDNWSIIDFDRSDYFSLYVQPTDGRIGFSTRSQVGGTHDLTSDATGLNDGEWHHVAVTYGAGGKAIYVDGVLSGTADPHSGNPLGSPNTRFGFLGDGSEAFTENGTRNNFFYDGSLDNVAMWTRELTATEIADLAAGGGVLDATNLTVAGLGGTTDATGTSALGAAVSIAADGSFTYDPTGTATLQELAPGETLLDSFEYTVEDGLGNLLTAAVTVEVAGLNDAPLPDDDTILADEDGPITVTGPGVLDGDTDPEGDNLAVASFDASGALGAVSMDVLMEIGEVGVLQGVDHNAQTVSFSRDFVNPVVIAQPLSYNDPDAALPQIIDVDAALDQFTIRIVEAPGLDGVHAPETVHYIVLEAGLWQLGDGTLLEVGTVDTDDTVNSGVGTFDTVALTSGFGSAPVVLTQAQTSNDPTAPFFKTRTRSVGPSGFQVALEEAENGDASHATETVGYFAIDTGSGAWNGLVFEAATVTSVNDAFRSIDFGQHFEEPPAFLGALSTYSGLDPAGLRYQNLDADGVQVFAEEDKSFDAETVHAGEFVGYLAVGGTGLLTAFAQGADNGGVTYDPAGQFEFLGLGDTAEDTFTYTVTDNLGLSQSATVTVVVQGANDQPEAANAAVATTNAAGLFSLDLLDPAISSDVDASDVLSITSVLQDLAASDRDLEGAFSFAGGVLSFDTGLLSDLLLGESEVLVFDYVVDDGEGQANSTASGTITVTVVGANDPPVATDDAYSTDEDVPLVGNVISDDTGAGIDFDPNPGDTIQIVAVEGDAGAVGMAMTLDSGATLVVAADGSFTYTPAAGFVGSDSFTYTIGDGKGGFDTATVTIEVDNLVDLSGVVFEDADNDGVQDTGEAGLAGIRVRLFDQATGDVLGEEFTGADGSYTFDANLTPGTYEIVADQPDGLLDGDETAGGLDGSVDNTQDSNAIRDIVISEGDPDADGYLFAEIAPSEIGGVVWKDFNNDGEINFGEAGIEGVLLTLTGTDDRGNAVDAVMQQTGEDGAYLFSGLRPGTYTINESQPEGFVDGAEVLGTVGGAPVGNSSVNDRFSGIALTEPGSEGEGYNFGEQPGPQGSAADSGQTNRLDFWNSAEGQQLLESLNGGPNATQLGNWLAATFPNLYGAGGHDLAGMTNAEIADLFQELFRNRGGRGGKGPAQLDAQVLATALTVYVTNETLAGDAAEAFGFVVSEDGLGARTIDVGSNGGAFGVPDGSVVRVMDLLLAADAQASDGILYDLDGDGDANGQLEGQLRLQAFRVFSTINKSGDSPGRGRNPRR